MTLPPALPALRKHGLFLCLLAFGIAVRSCRFGSVPNGLFQDEASLGYDAFSLLHYGIDRIGYHHPIMLDSWGSGMYALPAYISLPSLYFFGLSDFSVRLPFLFYGITGMIVFYALCLALEGLQFARLACFLLVIAPWHIMMSRFALDSNLFPTLFLIAFYALVRAKDKPALLCIAALFFALSLYAYGTAYLVVPLFGMQMAWHWRAKFPFPVIVITGAALLFAAVAWPVAYYILINHFGLAPVENAILSIPRLSGPPRFETVANGAHMLGNAAIFLHLLFTQNDGLQSNDIPAYGELYLFSLPFMLWGMVTLLRTHALDNRRIMLSWLLAACAVGLALQANVNRMNIVYFPLIYCTALGLMPVMRYSINILAAVIFAYVLACASFLQDYFGTAYRHSSAGFFAGDIGNTIRRIDATTQGPVCVTWHFEQPYIYVLFYLQTDPHDFINHVQLDGERREFHQVQSFGRYYFGRGNCLPGTTVFIKHR